MPPISRDGKGRSGSRLVSAHVRLRILLPVFNHGAADDARQHRGTSWPSPWSTARRRLRGDAAIAASALKLRLLTLGSLRS